MKDLRIVRLMPGTKLSHDMRGGEVETFSYIEAMALKIPEIGVHCKINNLVVIDIDVPGTSHKHDGRPWWQSFATHNEVPTTYTVSTRSGGYHLYFKLPEYINPDNFSPPAMLAQGVDVRWNAIVAAPPTPGYAVINGSIETIADLPDSLLQLLTRRLKGSELVNDKDLSNLIPHKPFSQVQIRDLKDRIKWVQQNAALTREQWRNGIFSISAAVQDQDEAEALAIAWTQNQAYEPGDEEAAISMLDRSDPFGAIGPGTILSIIRELMIDAGATEVDSSFNVVAILDRAKIKYDFDKRGNIKVEPCEYNVSAVVGAMYDKEELYYDTRKDLIMFNDEPKNEEMLTNYMLPRIQAENFGLGMEKFRKQTVKNGLEVLMTTRGRDPHADFVAQARWDGVSRVETFFSTYLGVPDTEYTRAAAKSFWVSIAARGIKPGSKVDFMLILEGGEGIRKSSLVRAIGGDYTYTPSRDDVFESENELRKLHQAAVVELPELMGLKNKSPDIVKGHITVTHDEIRGLYEKRALTRPRGFILVGTTNDSNYISTNMGWRRFLPIRIPKEAGKIDVDSVIRDRENLFAEAREMYLDGYEYWNINYDMQRAQVMGRIVVDPIQGEVDKLIDKGVTDVPSIYNHLAIIGYINKGLTVKTAKRLQDRIDTYYSNREIKATGFSTLM